MTIELTRRDWLRSFAGVFLSACAARHEPHRPAAGGEPRVPDPFGALEAELGGRVGVFALDTGTERTLAHRADERFAMCSTFKWALVASILARADRGELALDDAVPFGEADLLDYAPVTRANVERGAMTVEALAEAAVTVSDNTAANLLLVRAGGPVGLTAFFRGLGDTVTRLDRNEPTLNTNLPGDPRDTTSPRAMVGALRRALVGDALSQAARARLIAWLQSSSTGRERLRAGLPTTWNAGDKTGTCGNGANNDVAIAWPPSGPPILIASYLSGSGADGARLNAAHAQIGKIVAAAWGPG